MADPKQNAPTIKLNSAQVSVAEAPFVERVPIIETFVDGIAALSVSNGALKLSFYVDRQLPGSNNLEHAVVARLVMMPEAANSISATLRQILTELVNAKQIPPLQEVTVA